MKRHQAVRQAILALIPLGAALLTGPLAALTLELPAKVVGEERRTALPGSYALPIAPFDGVRVPARVVEGALDQRAFELAAPGMTTLAIMAPLRDQVRAAGFEVLLDCAARACGGFDFRFGTEVLPEPEMHVDMGDFRFLSAERPGEALSILVSRSAHSAFVQVTRVTAAPVPDRVAGPRVDLDAAGKPPLAGADAAAAPIGAALDERGSAVLDGLVFASGSASLSNGETAALAALAAWLAANPKATVALVGHTDTAGSLTANLALSERRAEAVAEILVARYGVDPARVAAKGVGFLAPRATNQTEQGRQLNRRVEVIVTSIR